MNRMKRIAMPLLAAAAIWMLTAAAAALAPGEVYLPDEGGRMTVQVSQEAGMIPGKTYYIALAPAPTANSLAGSIGNKLTVTAQGVTSRDVDLVQSLGMARRRIGAGAEDWWWFAELTWKSMSTPGAYSVDGYAVRGTLKVGDLSVSLDDWMVAYPEGEKRLRAEPQLFHYRDEEAGVFLPDGRSFVIIDSKGVESKLVLAMSTVYNDSLAKQYPEAKLAFFVGNDAGFQKETVIAITGRKGDYLYEYRNGALTDLSNSFNSRANAFTFKTRTLGFFVRSDRPLGQPTAAVDTSLKAPGPGSSPSKGMSNDALSDMVQKYFSNNFALASYGNRYEKLESAIPIRCKADLSALNTETLHIYAYDEAQNNLLELSDHGAKLNEDGYLYFNTTSKGRFVITDAPLTAR